MLFLVSVVLATLPVLGIAYMFLASPALTVDNIFLSLMLLTISGIFGLDVLMQLKENRWRPPLGFGSGSARARAGQMIRVAEGGTLAEAGVVDSMGYFESEVGRPNRFILTLRDNSTQPHVLVFNGDLRDQFTIGLRVAIKYRKEPEANTLLERRYV